jgi:hypothetical protein
MTLADRIIALGPLAAKLGFESKFDIDLWADNSGSHASHQACFTSRPIGFDPGRKERRNG